MLTDSIWNPNIEWTTVAYGLSTTSCAHVALKYLIKATKYMPEISYAPHPVARPVDLRGVLD